MVVSGYDNVYSLLVKNADYTSNRTYASMPQLFQEIAAITPGKPELISHYISDG